MNEAISNDETRNEGIQHGKYEMGSSEIGNLQYVIQSKTLQKRKCTTWYNQCDSEDEYIITFRAHLFYCPQMHGI